MNRKLQGKIIYQVIQNEISVEINTNHLVMGQYIYRI